MKKFLAIYYAPASAMGEMMTMTPEDEAKGMGAWMAWKAKNDAHVVDFGAPVMGGQIINTIGGDWSNSTKEVTGYSIVQGNDVDEVKALFADHPHLSWATGCYVELSEFAPM